jgi:hypothetical protein
VIWCPDGAHSRPKCFFAGLDNYTPVYELINKQRKSFMKIQEDDTQIHLRKVYRGNVQVSGLSIFCELATEYKVP